MPLSAGLARMMAWVTRMRVLTRVLGAGALVSLA
jgi:hypothetical protein